MARKPAEIAPVIVRMPERLRRQLAAAAKKANRSINQEMVHRLEQSFTEEPLKEMARSQREGIIAIAEHIGRPDIVEHLNKKGESDNG